MKIKRHVQERASYDKKERLLALLQQIIFYLHLKFSFFEVLSTTALAQKLSGSFANISISNILGILLHSLVQIFL